MIIKLENQVKSPKKMNYEKNGNNLMINNNIEPYRKKKRKRRKKTEIQNIYNCPFHKCKKSYPSKGSLNMHIKLKHQNEKFFSFDAVNKQQ